MNFGQMIKIRAGLQGFWILIKSKYNSALGNDQSSVAAAAQGAINIFIPGLDG